ncbi:UNVERIFIED_CONTAM: hypothetical protein H355_011102 [Colinus virginianus]|nr:hypothetical protein H355_011102 [Colinus virginianus]
MESWCRSKWSSGAYGTWRPHVAAWRGERAVARCAAAERVPWLPAGADFCEVAELPAARGKRRGEGLEDGRAGEQQKGDTVVSPSLLTNFPADNEQSGHLRSERVADSSAGVSSAVEDSQGGKRKRGDSETGATQVVALGEGHQRGTAAGEEPPQHQHHDSPLWRSEENRPFERKLEDALLFCGNSNKPLATAVADRLSTKLGKVAVKRFADGEVNIQFLDSLRGKDVYLIQPTSTPVNEHLMELLLMISTCRRASAKKITAVIPYYGYARQDRKLSSRVPISAADVARMIEAMGVDRVVAVDLHCGQIQGFFGPRVPVDNLEAQIIGLEYFQHKNLQKPVVVSPDAGGVYRARKFQEGLLARGCRDCGIAMLIKQRLRANEIERMDLVGSVEGSDVIIVDDMIDTAGTLCEAARELRAKGARRVFAFATHGLFSGPALNRIESSPLEEVVVTDSIQAITPGCIPDNVDMYVTVDAQFEW